MATRVKAARAASSDSSLIDNVKPMLLTGAPVQEWFEMSAGPFNQVVPAAADSAAEQGLLSHAFPCFSFDALDGVTRQMDLSKPAKYPVNGALINTSAIPISIG